MEFEEVKKLRKVFDKYLNYKGINLWMLSEYLIYFYSLRNLKKHSLKRQVIDNLSKYLVKTNNSYRYATKKRPLNSKKEILMIVYSPVHVITFKPIIEKMKNIRIINCDSPFSQITKKTLKKNKIPYINLDSYFNKDVKKELKKAEKWLDLQWKKIKKNKKIKKEIGKNYKSMINVLEYFMKTRKKFLENIMFIELLNKVYSIEKNKIVIVADEINSLGKAAIMVANDKKIHSLVVQHATLTRSITSEIIAEKITLGGEKERNFLMPKKSNTKKIEVTGQSRFDEIKRKLKKTKEQACREIGLNPNKKIIVFAAQYNAENQRVESAIEEFLKTIREIKNKKDFEFIIKLHPSGNKKDIPKIDKKEGIKIVKDINLYSLLSACDILITASSVVGIEAVLLNKPVITIEIEKINTLVNYEEEGVGISIYEKNSLLAAINKVLYDASFKEKFVKYRKKFIKDFAYKLDGKSTNRIINLINKMIRN